MDTPDEVGKTVMQQLVEASEVVAAEGRPRTACQA